VSELRDSAIWAATCDLTARVLRNDPRPAAARAALPGAGLVTIGVALLFVLPAVVGLLVVAVGILLLLAGAVVFAAGSSTAGSGTAGHLMLEADGFTYRAFTAPAVTMGWRDCGRFDAVPSRWTSGARVAWTGGGAGTPGALLPGAGGLPADDLAVLLNRYRQHFASGSDA
jgi:hypothetical protein